MIDILNLSSLVYQPPGTNGGAMMDQSVALLNNIFGSPIQVLMGSPGANVSMPGTNQMLSGSLLTEILSYFNTALLGIALIIFGYLTFVGTIHTARDGRFLGKLDSHWTPLRVIFGPTAMFPVKGFCLAQYLVMYFILVGVNLADVVWRASLDQMLVQPPAGTPSALNTHIAKELGTIFVYKSIQDTIAHYTQPANKITVNVTGGSLSIFGQYQDKFKDALYTACGYPIPVSGGTSTTGTSAQTSSLPANHNHYSKLCSEAVDSLFANQVNTIFYPAAPVPTRNLQGQSPFVNIYLSLAGSNASIGNAGGAFSAKYVFDPSTSLDPRIQVLRIGETMPAGAKVISKSGSYPIIIELPKSSASACSPSTSSGQTPAQISTDWLACQLNKNIKKTVIDDNGIVKPDATLTATQVVQQLKTDGSFQGLIGDVIQKLETDILNQDSAKGKSLLNQGIPGTGFTCNQNGTGIGHYQCIQNGQPVKPVYYSNSWWYASDVYLNLNNQLAKNINNLAKAVGQFQLQPSQISFGSFVGKPCPNDPGSATCVQPAMNVKMAVVNYTNGESVDTKTKSPNPMSFTTAKGLLNYNSAPSGQTKNQISGTITLDPISGSNLNMMFKSWSDLICPYRPSFYTSDGSFNVNSPIEECNKEQAKASSNTTKLSTSKEAYIQKNPQGSEAFYGVLESMPQQYQVPIGSLLYLTEQAYQQLYCGNKAGCTITERQALANTQQIIMNIVSVLVLNHIYPGSETQPLGVDTQSEISPVQRMVQQALNHIVGKRLPGNYTPVPKGSNVAQDAQQTVGQIFYEIYSLGNKPASSWQDVVNQSFNNIANAQSIGLMMISTVVNAIESTSQFIQNTMSGFINSDRKTVRNIEITAGVGGGVSAITSGVGAAFGSTALETAALVAETGTQIGVMVQQIQLQQKMVNQNYDMMMDLMWIPVGIMVATLMFTAGLSFSLVVPLIPYILFWAGQIAWLLGVIEAMIAAPLLALALTHPGGHETWGHTVPGLRMLIGVILRPVLMVIGLITGLILTFVVIKFSSQGFQIISTQILSYAGSVGHYGSTGPNPYGASAGSILGPNATITQGVMAVLMLFLFCSFMVMAFNKCFSTIYLFPEKVVQWFGGQAMSAGKEEMQQMSSKAEGMGSQGMQAAGSSMQSMGQASSSNVQQQGQAGMGASEKSLGMAQAGNKAAGGVGKAAHGSKKGSGSDGGGIDSENKGGEDATPEG